MNEREIRKRARYALEDGVAHARRLGLTWDAIGRAMGAARQTVHRRFWTIAQDTGPQRRWAAERAETIARREDQRRWPSTFRPQPPFRVEKFAGSLILPGGERGNYAVDLHVVDGRGRTCRVFDRFTHYKTGARQRAALRYCMELERRFG